MAATVHVTLAVVQDRAVTGSTLPVPPAAERTAETLTSSAGSAVGTLVSNEGEVWIVTVSGGNVWVKYGSGTPTAASGSGYLLLAGSTQAFGADAGQKMAIKDAP